MTRLSGPHPEVMMKALPYCDGAAGPCVSSAFRCLSAAVRALSASTRSPALRHPRQRRRGAQRPGGGGSRGGRGNPMAALYTERCAACHGTEPAAGAPPNLFDDQWTRAKDDRDRHGHRDGVPQTEMIRSRTS